MSFRIMLSDIKFRMIIFANNEQDSKEKTYEFLFIQIMDLLEFSKFLSKLHCQ